MNIPNFVDEKMIDNEGYLTDNWKQVLSQLFAQMHQNLSNEGHIIPGQSTSNISTIFSTSDNTGGMLYDQTSNQFKGNVNGTIKIFQMSTSSSLSPNSVVITDALGDITSSADISSTELNALDNVTGNIQVQLNGKEPTITAGLVSQYWRGDKTWQTLDTLVVPENTNLYYTDARARLAISNSAPITYSSLTGVIGIIQSGVASDGYLSSTDWNTFNNKEPAITAGTTAQYWRGDKTWQDFNTAARAAISATAPVTYNSGTGVIGFSQRSVLYPAETSANYNNRRVRTVAGAGAFRFNFFVPADFNSLVSCHAIGYVAAGAAGSGKNIDITVEYTTAQGQLYNQYTASDTTTTYDLTGYTDRQYRLPITALLTNLSPNAEGGIFIDHNSIGGNIYYVGILLVYN